MGGFKAPGDVLPPLRPERSEVEASRYAPYPEIACPGPRWRVIDSTGRTDLPSIGVTDMENRVIYTPLRADGVEVSTHELGHVLFSPPKLPKVRFPQILLMAVEDARVNLALAAAGRALHFDAERSAEIRLRGTHDLKRGEFHVFLLRLVASLGTGEAPVLFEELASAPAEAEHWVEGWVTAVETRLERARVRSGKPVAPFPVALRIARDLARNFDACALLDEALRVPGQSCCVADTTGVEERGARRRPRFLADLPEEGGAPGPYDKPGVRPGKLRVTEAPMPLGRTARPLPMGRRYRPATEGCHVARPHRWALDRAIFRRAVRARGGTVLIDVSGSMRLSAEMVQSLVEASGGAALVAIYSGRAREGELRIVARGGRRAAEEGLEPFGNGNIVDLPALEWLGRQHEPRIWVSDGGVTGMMDKSSPEIRKRCGTVVRQHRIQQVADSGEAVKRLAASGRGTASSGKAKKRRAPSPELEF